MQQADVRQISEDAAKLAALPVWPLSDDEITDMLRTAHRWEQAAVALQARLVREATSRGLPGAQGHRSVAGWLRTVLVLDPQPARELRQEARAHEQRGLTLSMPVDGRVRVSGVLGAEDAATVHAALHPLCQPIPDDDRSPAQRRADALVDVCRLALRTGSLPDDGGEPPQLAVTVAYDPVTRALGAATTDTGRRLSAATARRLACDARILPVVLGGSGQILDAGRTRRLATGPLRRALHIRDGGCAFPDCDRPPRWTDAHHITAWTAGGATTLDNLVLLCRHHHRLVHHETAGWTIHLGPDHQPDFIPPPHIDPTRQPRRNLYHRRQ